MIKEYIDGDACTLCSLSEYCDEYKKGFLKRFANPTACNIARIKRQSDEYLKSRHCKKE